MRMLGLLFVCMLLLEQVRERLIVAMVESGLFERFEVWLRIVAWLYGLCSLDGLGGGRLRLGNRVTWMIGVSVGISCFVSECELEYRLGIIR